MRLSPGVSFGVLLGMLLPSADSRASGPAQSPSTSTASAALSPSSHTQRASVSSDRYAAEAAVIEHLGTVYRYNADGTGTKEITVAIRLQTDAAVRQFGVVSLPFASASEQEEFVYVRVRRASGEVLETPVADAMEQPTEVTRQAPFYSDLKEKQIPVRSLRPGDTLEYQAREIRTVPEVPGHFWGTESPFQNIVTLDETTELRVPRSKEVTVWSPKNKPTVAEEGAERVYRWRSSNLIPTAGKEAEARKEAEKGKILPPDEVLDNREGKLPVIAWTTFKSWAEVGAWYRSLEADRAVADPAVKAKVAELTAGKQTEEEKARALYAYVSAQVRYIGVALGIGRYQPHAAGEVLRNQYGDCKDKHTLLAAMLKQAGLHPDAALIGAGIRFNEAVPSPAAFNHLITTVSIGGKPVWLDATQEVAPYRVLLYVLRDKRALVIPETAAASLETTPANLPFPALDHYDSVATLDKDGTTWSLRGDDEVALRLALHSLSPGQYPDFTQNLSGSLGFAGTTSHVEISRPELTDEPLHLAYDYRREKPGDDWEHFRIVPLLHSVSLASIDEKDLPRMPIELGPKRVDFGTSSMKLPTGWGATLPDPVHVKTSFASVDETFRFEKGTLYADRRLEIFEERVPAENWKGYKKFYEDALIGHERYIQLTSTGDRKAETQPPLPTSSNEEAHRRIAEAIQAVQSRDFDTAEKSLHTAEALNEHELGLWSAYGSLAFFRGEVTEAIADIRKELAQHADEGPAYAMLAGMQLIKGQRAEAETTMQQLLEKSGPDLATSMQLASMLTEDGKPADAAKLLDAVEPDKRNPSFEVALGTAELKAGETARGQARLVGLLKEATDPSLVNDAAYTLGDANLEVSLAESKSRTAVDQLTAESAQWRLDGDLQAETVRGALLIASWDTLGWILFREGRLPEAESWTRAAWLQMPRPETGLHLGIILEAEHKAAEALRTYRMAIASVPRTGMEASSEPATATARELKARAAALHSRRELAAVDTRSDANSELQALRKLPVGASAGRSGTADYRLKLVGGTVAEALGPSPATLADGDAVIRRLKLTAWWPPQSQATLLRRGILNCHQAVCEVVLLPL